MKQKAVTPLEITGNLSRDREDVRAKRTPSKKYPLFLTGFTLLETIIVLTIITIVFAVSIPLFSRLAESAKLNTAARSVVSVLRTARGYAISQNTNYYVFFDSVSYYISDTDDGINIIEKVYELPTGITFQIPIDFTGGAGGADGDGACFRPTGELDEVAQDTSIVLQDAGGELRTITVERTTGRVRID